MGVPHLIVTMWRGKAREVGGDHNPGMLTLYQGDMVQLLEEGHQHTGIDVRDLAAAIVAAQAQVEMQWCMRGTGGREEERKGAGEKHSGGGKKPERRESAGKPG